MATTYLTTAERPAVSVRIPRIWLTALIVSTAAGLSTTGLALTLLPYGRESAPLAATLIGQFGLVAGLGVLGVLKVAGIAAIAELAHTATRGLADRGLLPSLYPLVIRHSSYLAATAYYLGLAVLNVWTLFHSRHLWVVVL